MKSLLLFCFALSLSTVLKSEPVDKGNLLMNILEANDIYQMTAEDRWVCLAGNPEFHSNPTWELDRFTTEEEKRRVLKFAHLNFEQRMEAEGNMYLYFKISGSTPVYFVMSQYDVKWLSLFEKEIHRESYPKSPFTRKALVWICKNRWLLKKLKEGELTVEDYRFSRDEFIFIMRFCPEEWGHSLVKYAASDTLYTQILDNFNYLDCIISSLSRDAKFRASFPFLEGIETEKIYYSAVISAEHDKAKQLLNTDYLLLIKKIEKATKLTEKEKLLISLILGNLELNKTRLHSYKELSDLRKYIIKHKDKELLKVYLKRVQRRQSAADIPVLGEFLQSDLYLKGTEEYRNIILDQCAIRKENEIVWLLAESTKLPIPGKDASLEEILQDIAKFRAIEIMMKFTKKDLGDEPEAWKKWYREQ